MSILIGIGAWVISLIASSSAVAGFALAGLGSMVLLFLRDLLFSFLGSTTGARQWEKAALGWPGEALIVGVATAITAAVLS
ncbi:hypothetical protein H9657_15360 [Cellulomonas sp. Sa3CUA2]|uniref:Uncharacterized protein n=1 Tax=Cellulomonas avistercoris TaxID=2762242 RepID=A0ABR8QGU8_9CELL|nr:hypothetical protein [Cellulomonas avistercoris]MBD7919647.1 hypothetical protein [Cellulomonas avistercoris]